MYIGQNFCVLSHLTRPMGERKILNGSLVDRSSLHTLHLCTIFLLSLSLSSSSRPSVEIDEVSVKVDLSGGASRRDGRHVAPAGAALPAAAHPAAAALLAGGVLRGDLPEGAAHGEESGVEHDLAVGAARRGRSVVVDGGAKEALSLAGRVGPDGGGGRRGRDLEQFRTLDQGIAHSLIGKSM